MDGSNAALYHYYYPELPKKYWGEENRIETQLINKYGTTPQVPGEMFFFLLYSTGRIQG